MDSDDVLRRIPSAPDSVQRVVRELCGSDPMTGKQLREATGLPRRTIYSALRRLRDVGLLREQLSLRDTRQRYLWLDEQAINRNS